MQDYLLLLQLRLEKFIFCFLPNNINVTMYIILNLSILRPIKYDIQGMRASLMSSPALTENIEWYSFYLHHSTYMLESRSIAHGESGS
jgi:hypothetical protein